MKGKHKTIVLDRINDPEFPLRSDLSHEAVATLTASIKQVGIIEPLVVRKKGEDFEVIAGHRRLVAAGIAGLTEAPCIIVKADDQEAEIIKLHENLNRNDINPIDWANHLHHLKKQYTYSNAKLGKMLGMSESWVTQHLAIMQYDAVLIEALNNDFISFSSARELAQIKDPKTRGVYTKHAITGGVTPKLAAKWRKEANREYMPENNVKPVTPPAKKEEAVTQTLPVCVICQQGIKPEEELRMVIHQACAPK